MKSLIITLLLLSSFFSNAQNTQDFTITYSYVNYGLKKNVSCELITSNDKSIFVFGQDNAEDSVFLDESEVVNFSISGKDSIGQCVFKDFSKQEIVFRDFVFSNNENTPFIVVDEFPDFSWEITNIKETVNNIKCIKATTSFRGRSYDAWYAVDIPINNGPWKFHGLPGLIIKVVSLDNKIQFAVTSIKQTTEQSIADERLLTDQTISFEEYAAYREKAVDEFIQKLYSKLPRGASIKVNSSIDHNIETEFK
jgi:GLPGLI family protein